MSSRWWRRRDLLIATGLSILLPGGLKAAQVSIAEPSFPRRLRLKNVHTGETFDGPYRDETGPIPSAVADLAAFLRDFHVNKIGPLDVGALDFLADVMGAIGESSASVLSAYRTPETNARLRATMFGVAEKSQHMYGRAIDVSFDRRLLDAETVARRMARGGVGWYPRSHFVHLDTGPTRSWEMNGTGLDRVLSAGGYGERAPREQAPLSVADRLARHRALARGEFLHRRR
jgi:uncharacterized protein YcbK (DUF882 family)